MPAFLRYDRTITARFPISAKKSVTLFNQNSLLTSYPGASAARSAGPAPAGATYIGMARRNGVTLIVTLLHCPALTEIDSAESLLNWGFAADGKVSPGRHAGQPAAAAARRRSASAAAAAAAARRPTGGRRARPPRRPPARRRWPPPGSAARRSRRGRLGFAYSRRQRAGLQRGRRRVA